MRYVLMCLLALVICFGCAYTFSFIIGKYKKMQKKSIFLMSVTISVLLIICATFGYLSVYYHADSSAYVTSENVQMLKIDGGYLFDGPGETSALIFYPGAKVDTLAYAPLMTSLAEEGVDCFLADMPFHIAFFGGNLADKFMEQYTYDNWGVAGHSLGGVVVSNYATKHADQIKHLILLASFPQNEIPDDIQFCSIYGSRDGCLSLESYEKAKEYWPVFSDEFILEGGNHAQYANYGPQADDLNPEMTREEQQKKTLDIILDAMEK